MKTLLRTLVILILASALASGATLVSAGTGNWTANTTWKIGEAGAGAVMVTRSASTSSTSTTTVWSSAWTCTNLDVLEGVVLHLKRNGTTGTITMSVSADNGVSETRSSAATNLSSIPEDQTEYYFALSSTLTCDGGADYKVGVKFSAGASGATVYRDGTANNWFRVPMTSANPAGAPAAGDNLHVAGGYTVTMDSTDSTDHGTLDIGNGTVTFGIAESTNYVLKLSGDLNLWAAGGLNQGTVASPMPATSTGTILMDCGSNVQYGIYVRSGGTWVAQGASKTVWTYLAADASVNATSLTTADSTGWKNGESIAIASTTRTAGQGEKGTLNGDAAGTTLTVNGFGGVGGGLAYAHLGTAPMRAEIINLTRNVVVKGASAANQTYISVEATAAVNWDYVEFYWIGSATSLKYGISLSVTANGSFDARYCSLHDFVVTGSYGFVQSSATGDGFYIGNNVGWAINSGFYSDTPTSGVAWTVTGNVVLGAALPLIGLNFTDIGGTMTNNVVAGSGGNGINLGEASTSIGTFSGNTTHSCAQNGIQVTQSITGGTILNHTSWRNNGAGYRSTAAKSISRLTIDGGAFFGNDISMYLESHYYKLTVKNTSTNGLTVDSSSRGFLFANGHSTTDMYLDNCLIGVASGIYTSHTTADIVFNNSIVQITGRNTNLGSATKLSGLTSGFPESYYRAEKYGQVAGDHRTYYQTGSLIQSDAVIYKTAAPSERVTPASATVKVEGPAGSLSLASGGTATVSVWARKSSSGDAGGADYNGSQPRLIVKANPACGIMSDAILDTMTAAVGNWEQLSGTTAAVTADCILQFVMDGDGTAGWFNVDDANLGSPASSTGFGYWLDGLPAVVGGGGTKSFGWPQ